MPIPTPLLDSDADFTSEVPPSSFTEVEVPLRTLPRDPIDDLDEVTATSKAQGRDDILAVLLHLKLARP